MKIITSTILVLAASAQLHANHKDIAEEKKRQAYFAQASGQQQMQMEFQRGMAQVQRAQDMRKSARNGR